MKERILLKLLKQIVQYKWWIITGLLLSTFTIAAGIGLMVTAAYLISLCAIAIPLSQLQPAISGVRFFGTVRGFFRYFERIVSHNTTFKLLKQYRVWFYEKIEPLAPAVLSKFRSGDLLRRIVADVENLENVYARFILPPISLFLTIIVMYIFFSFINIHVALLTAASLFTSGYLLSFLFYNLSKKYSIYITDMQAKISTISIDINQGFSDLAAFGQLSKYHSKFEVLNKKLMTTQNKLAFMNSINLSLVILVMHMTVLGAIILLLPILKPGLHNGIISSMVVLGILASYEAVFPLTQSSYKMGSVFKSASRIFDILDAKPIVNETQTLEKTTIEETNISIKNLSFMYNDDANFSLKDININIEQNSKVAFVGPSGSGKTSIASLLMRFYESNSGIVNIGNIDLKKIKQEDISKYISLCSQKVYLFNTSIRNNLKLSNKAATEEEIINSLKLAQAYDFVIKLPNGLDTCVGEHGLKLSGGELRRIGIARTLLSYASILIFDEANSDLDKATGTKVLENILSIKNKTIILISHLFTKQFKELDNIIVINNGKVVENGNHKKLIGSRSGLYRKMFDLQH